MFFAVPANRAPKEYFWASVAQLVIFPPRAVRTVFALISRHRSGLGIARRCTALGGV